MSSSAIAPSVTGASPALRIAVAGASGRMGQMLVQAVMASPDLHLAAALDLPGSPAVGQDAAAFAGKTSGVRVSADVPSALAQAQVLIDFTRPEGTLAHLAQCAQLGVQAVVGTTGFSPEQQAKLQSYAQRTGIVWAPNMSVGVNVLLKLVEDAARQLGDAYDLEVIEAHHKHKVDAPSGTALALGEALARGRSVKLAEKGVFTRHGHTGEREAGSIGFSTVRGGDLVGEHTVMFIGTGERIEISHQSTSRAFYADGSMRAARFIASKPTGLFNMKQVLGLA